MSAAIVLPPVQDPRFAFPAYVDRLVTFKRCPNPGTECVGLQMADRNHRARMRHPPFRTWDGRAAGPARHMEHSCGAYVEVLSSRPSSLCECYACTPSVASPSIPPYVCACSSGRHRAAPCARRCPIINSGLVPCFQSSYASSGVCLLDGPNVFEHSAFL